MKSGCVLALFVCACPIRKTGSHFSGTCANLLPSTRSPAMTALPIDMVSDVVCPWCFIGKRRLEKAIALKPEIPVEVRFRPYFLNPWVARDGISREDYLTTK